MRFTVTASSLIAALALAGCTTTRTVIEEVPVEVYVPVAVGCLPDTDGDGVGERPTPVIPMRDTISEEQWRALAPGAKAEAVRVQAGRRMNHADQLEAATFGCQ
jgi:hypothetical protein